MQRYDSATATRRPFWLVAGTTLVMGALAFGMAYLVRSIQFENNKLANLTDKSGNNPISLSAAKSIYGVQEVLDLSSDNDAVPVPAVGAYWGMHANPGDGGDYTVEGRKKLLNYLADITGRDFDIDRQYYQWGAALPNAYINWTVSQGRIPHISVKPPGKDWKGVGAGNYDAYIRSTARGLRDLNAPVFFTFHHEPEAEVGDYGTTADYRNAWKRIDKIFKEENADNVAMSWVLTSYWFHPRAGSAKNAVAADMYPGDDVVDWIAADPYNYVQTDKYTELTWEMEPWYNWARKNHPSKPLQLAEWGTEVDPNDPDRVTSWFENALRDFKAKFPAVKAVSYFHSKKIEARGPTNNLIDQSPQFLSAFKAVGLDPYFIPLFGDITEQPPAPDPENPPITQAVTPPTNVVVTPGDGSLSVSWDPNPVEQGVNKYVVRYKKVDSNDWVWTEWFTDTFKAVTGLTNGTAYEVEVRAIVNNETKSNYSATVVATPRNVDVFPPNTPVGITLTAKDNSIVVNWYANIESDFKEYAIQYKAASDLNFTWLARTNETTYTISNLSYDKSYSVQVRAVDQSENASNWSASYSIAIPPESSAPAIPTGLKAVKKSSTSIYVTWNANTESDLKSYAVRYRTATGDWVWPGRRKPNNQTLSGLKAGQRYEIQVRAVDKNENRSDYTESVFVQL